MLPLLLLVLAAPKGAATTPSKPALPTKAAVFVSSPDEGQASQVEKQLTEALEGQNVSLVDVTAEFPTPEADASGGKLMAAAKQAYDDLDYDGASAKWNEALEFFAKHPESAEAKTLSEAHFFLAVVALQSGGKNQAKKAQEGFARALVLDPELTCDANTYGADVKKVFDKASSEVTARPTAKVSIESTPSGAKVFLRGKKVGRTPLADSISVPTGRHFVQLSHPGYANSGVFIDVSKEGGKATATLTAAPGYEELRDGVSSAVGKGVGQKGALPGNAHKLGEVAKARFLVMSDGTTAEVWDVDSGNRLAGLSLSAEELPETAKRISQFIAKPGPAAVAAATGGDEPTVTASASGPIYTQWWFWTAVGVVVVGGATTVGVVAANNSGPRPFNVVLGTP